MKGARRSASDAEAVARRGAVETLRSGSRPALVSLERSATPGTPIRRKRPRTRPARRRRRKARLRSSPTPLLQVRPERRASFVMQPGLPRRKVHTEESKSLLGRLELVRRRIAPPLLEVCDACAGNAGARNCSLRFSEFVLTSICWVRMIGERCLPSRAAARPETASGVPPKPFRSSSEGSRDRIPRGDEGRARRPLLLDRFLRLER